MAPPTSTPFRAAFTLCSVLAIAGLLGWEYTHGGVVSHHFLQRADMPAFSNWWGLLIVPTLAWFASARLIAANEGAASFSVGAQLLDKRGVAALAGAFLFGLGIAISFSNGLKSVLELLPFAMLLAAVTLPVFRPHYLLGFVMGMATAIGAVLPMIVGGVLGLLSAIVYFAIRPLIARAWSALRRK